MEGKQIPVFRLISKMKGYLTDKEHTELAIAQKCFKKYFAFRSGGR
jgi:hypothetical protein